MSRKSFMGADFRHSIECAEAVKAISTGRPWLEAQKWIFTSARELNDLVTIKQVHSELQTFLKKAPEELLEKIDTLLEVHPKEELKVSVLLQRARLAMHHKQFEMATQYCWQSYEQAKRVGLFVIEPNPGHPQYILRNRQGYYFNDRVSFKVKEGGSV